MNKDLILAIILSVPLALSLNMMFMAIAMKFNNPLTRYVPFPLMIIIYKNTGNLLFLISMLMYCYLIIISEHKKVKKYYDTYTG